MSIVPVCYNALYMKEDKRFYQERIVTNPRILAGKPVVKGTRIGVDLVLEELAHNPDITELLAAHPDLTRDDVQACLSYAQAIVTGEDVALLSPIKPVTKRRARGKPTSADDPLWKLVGIGHSGRGDISANKHTYLARAYRPH